MAEKYDKNGYNSSDFKRNAPIDESMENDPEQDGEDNPKINEKAGEYMRELLSEKIKLNNAKFPIITKLIDQEVTKVQASGRIPGKDSKYLDVFREKPTKVTVKVLVPVKEHPKFNFVGKLLGPKGNTMKHLQEETMCKMAVLGRGSMRDRQKEEELRNSLDPKYAHLSDELHVEISALASPAEAHARIAYALAEVKKYLVPDTNDMIWQTQMRDIERGGAAGARRGPPGGYGGAGRGFGFEAGAGASAPGGPRARPRMPPAPPIPRAMPPKNKVISILDRARSAMETSYPYDDVYQQMPEPPIRGPVRGAAAEPDFYYERGHDRYYSDEGYGYKEDAREYKSVRAVGTRRQHYARAEPYARPPKTTKKRSH
ncbi:KH domain-containing, RNA-binding, signal transduction-associated protein 2 isoform X2 [Helicoverpa armigera]|uniref:KH domain-containing, RNA-binding, signal transduction-associated protein 2 isoform X2 n=2 Tax=Helicoverpa armigera TaxID=29058 RepID=UPI0021120ADF|nr:KH domain-containing, RNA-binding, signal transduction-associated protein 2 isoform X2 [Helicoverpa armigera]